MLRPSLSHKIFFVALLNLVVLAAVSLVFARMQFRVDLSSFLLGPARDRIISASRGLALQLHDTDPPVWNKLLAQYSSRYPAEFSLVDQNGQELAGPPVTLPPAFLNELRRDNFARERRRMPPPEPGSPPDTRAEPGWNGERPPPPPLQAFSRQAAMPEWPLALLRTTNPVRYWVGVHIPIHREPRGEPIRGTLVWEIPKLWTEPFFFDWRPWFGGLVAVMVVSAICWLPLIRGLTRGIAGLTAATRQIADGQFDIEVHLKRRDELGQLSESINRMAHRLSGLVDGQKRFLSDVAHELSSPLARMQMALGILEQRAGKQRSQQDQLQYIADVREEVEHVSGLVNELLAFSKSRLSEKRLQLTPVPLLDLMNRVVAREHSDGVSIDVAIDPKIEVLAQPEFLFRATANVVRNAIRYAGPAGPVHISAGREGEDVCISIADHGPGLPESELENVFRPFYRPEFARQRETGGTGLGLAIVRDCVEACGGTVQCRNRTPSGLDVLIRVHAAA